MNTDNILALIMYLKAFTYIVISLMIKKFVVYQSYILQIHKQRVSGVKQYTLYTFCTLILISSSYPSCCQNLYCLSSSKRGRLLSLIVSKLHWTIPNN